MHGAYMMPSVSKMKTVYAAAGERDRTRRQKLLHEVFDGYSASSDFPGHAFVDDLLDMYPRTKIILNKRRTAEEWLASARSSLMFYSTWQYLVIAYWISQSYWHYHVYAGYKRLAKERYGVDDIFSVELYERHNQWVREVAEAHGKQLLEWEPADGWEPLCRFLGRDVPDVPFPRTNESAELAELKVMLIKRGLRAWAAVLGLCALTVATASHFYRAWV